MTTRRIDPSVLVATAVAVLGLIPAVSLSRGTVGERADVVPPLIAQPAGSVSEVEVAGAGPNAPIDVDGLDLSIAAVLQSEGFLGRADADAVAGIDPAVAAVLGARNVVLRVAETR